MFVVDNTIIVMAIMAGAAISMATLLVLDIVNANKKSKKRLDRMAALERSFEEEQARIEAHLRELFKEAGDK